MFQAKGMEDSMTGMTGIPDDIHHADTMTDKDGSPHSGDNIGVVTTGGDSAMVAPSIVSDE